MVLRLAILLWLGCLVVAGPVAWDDSKCSQKCNGGSNFQYLPDTSYIYSFESHNELQADRTSDLSIGMKATVEITVLSKCELVLQVKDASSQHGPSAVESSSFIRELKKNPLPFSWNDGKIEHVCPNPEDSNDVNNVKKAILSAFQNTLRTFEFDAFNSETDVLGTCDTEYQIKQREGGKVVIAKKKFIKSCSNHLKGQTLLTATPYESQSNIQSLPLLAHENYNCEQTFQDGILESVTCNENAAFKPLADYGYVVEATGHIKLQKLSSGPATRVFYKTPGKESLVFKYQAKSDKDDNSEEEARQIIQHLCSNADGLINKNAATYVHKLIYTIRRLSQQSLENIYTSLKNKEICGHRKIKSLYIDALKIASSGGSMGLLSKLVLNKELSEIDVMIWTTLIPFLSYVEEETITAAIPLLKKDLASRQALLGVAAMAFKFCSNNPDCETRNGLKELSSSLKQFLGDKCQSTNDEEETRVLSALKAFGNLGYVGESAEALLECANLHSNKIHIRIAALDAFRRSPCSEEISGKLLETYKNKNEEDELRIAALLTLSKCASKEILRQVVESYSSENSQQVAVFTWSYLKNLKASSDPLKAKLSSALSMMKIKEPFSTDVTKFSRNFELSLFSHILNIGQGIEGNLIHSKDSFLPRSGNVDIKANIFGNQLDLLEVGGRLEDIEHLLEELLGPRGFLKSLNIEDFMNLIPEQIRKKRSVEAYKSKIEALSERIGYKRNSVPRGVVFFRILGHELGLLNINQDSLERFANLDVFETIKKFANLKDLDGSRILTFLDFSVLFPSVTGRAYKLASNMSVTGGIKVDGKIDLRQRSLPQPNADIDGRFQPSILSDEAASFTIHSENFEPGVLVETTLHAGLDLQINLQLKNGRLLHLKLDRHLDRSEILSMKRTLYSLNHKGKVELPKPESYELNYCTKYVQKVLGVKYCASLTFPHVYNEAGKPKIPFAREMEASVVVEKVDKQMEGFELLLEIPETMHQVERRYRILFDTPKSAVNRKFSSDLTVRGATYKECTLTWKASTPFYTLDVDGSYLRKDESMQMKIVALGDNKRQYVLNLDVAADIRGARLVEYQPKITLTVPNVRPVEITGTVVFAKGRKAQITINLQSNSFDDPITIKGNLVKEGEINTLESNWKLHYEMNVNAFQQIHRAQAALGNEAGQGILLDFGHHYEPDGKSYESVTINAKVENIEIRDRLSFRLDSKILLAEHQDLNSMLIWDVSLKPLSHYKSDFIFRYGENFEDDTHLVRSTLVHALHGDFDNFQKMDIENKVGLTISCLDFDKSAVLTAVWDFFEKPKLIIEAGVKTHKDKDIHLALNYGHLSEKPLKITSDVVFTYKNYVFKYRDQAQEVAPNEYQGKAIIEPTQEKEITVDYTYRIKSQDHFHHEFDGTISFPQKSAPVQVKALLEFSKDSAKFNTFADTGSQSPYSIDVALQRKGTNEVKLATPFVEGNVIVDAADSVQTIKADFKAKGRSDNRRILMSGSITPGDINTMDLDIQWDADNDAEKKISIKAKSNRELEDGIEKHMISATINYVGSINVDVTGKVSSDFLRGPHYFKADFSGNMEPMAIEYSHEIKNGHMNSVAKYLRSGVEKIRTDLKGKYIFKGYTFELEAGLSLSSPYKTFDGKELYFRIMADSAEALRSFVAEYRIRPTIAIGYVGKFDYARKRGFPGNIQSNLIVTVHRRPIYEGSANVDYGNGKYTARASFTPISKKKINFVLSFEHAARFAAFHKSLSTSLQYLQSVEVNAVADLRNVEDAKIQSNIDVNSHKLYDVNSTLKMRSIIDFDGQIVLFSRITPSVHVFSKAQTSGQLTKFDMNLDIDSNSVITGSGELKKRKKGFNSDISFKYKEKEILVVAITQEAKTQRERNYQINVKAPSRTYAATVRVNKERKGSVKYETKLCRNDKCVNVDASHKEENDVDEWQIGYKRGSLEFNIERIRVSTNDLSRFHTVIYKGDKRYGYDLRIGKEGKATSVSFGTILPSREIIVKGAFELSIRNPKVKLELSLDGRNHPDRKLIIDTKFENHITDDNPSKLDVTLIHPIFEKPIIMHFAGDYEPASARFFTGEASIDYSSIPEEKLLAKLSIEKTAKGSGQMVVNMYHKDTKNLDFVMKANGTFNDEENTFGLLWLWKDEDGADKDAYALVTFPIKQRRFQFVYWRPKIQYKLEGKIITPDRLLEDTIEIDLTSEYNGAVTKAKYLADYGVGCSNLTIFNSEGEASRIIEVCSGSGSRKLYSVVIQSRDEEGQWVIDCEQEVVQKSLYTVGIKQHMTPDFLGTFLFQTTSLADELLEGGLGTLPISDSPQFKKIKSSFGAKVLEPAKTFLVQGAPKFAKDLKEDFTFLGATLRDYYQSLPPVIEVKQYFESMIPTLKHISYEIWTHIYAYYETYFRSILDFVDNVRQTVHNRCENNIDCRTLVKAYNEGGWRSLVQELRKILLALPEKIQDFLENPSTDAKNFFRRAITVLKAVLQPLTKYRCGEIVFKVVQLSYNALEPHVQKFMSNIPQYYKYTKNVLTSNPFIVQSAKAIKENYLKVRERILNIDYKRLYSMAKKCFEDYLLTINPPTPSRLITVHKIDGERGIFDFDLHTSAINQILSRVTSISSTIAITALDHRDQYSWNTLLVKLKRIVDLNFFPPYEAQAMIIANHHFVTFDKAFYDFSGECGYLLSRDFEDGNFTFLLKAKEADKEPTIFVIFKDVGIEIDNDKSVKANENAVELPYLSKDFSVTREGHTIVIDDRHGVQVKCNLVHQVCKFIISGWYYGKTAGLLGTYNYEVYDEFKRPKGQVANSATVLAKSWELKRGCKTSNLIPDVQINKNAAYYKLCQTHFESSSSLLAACFSEVEPKEYFELCLRHLAREGDNEKGLCNIAAAYVMECERNYVELNLPSKCLTCEAPDKSKLEHGDRKKYENLSKKSSDVVLIIEDSSCNKVVQSDFGNIARSIDRELQNEGFKDNTFGIVGYGGDIGTPKMYTSNGKIFFSSRDVSSVVEKIKLTSQKVEISRAFEAMKFAVTHLERSDTAKSFILFSCSPCKYDYKSLQYPIVQQILLERGISLHVINNNEIAVRKSTAKEKDIIGMDPDTVYHAKDVTQKILVGDPDLRSQVSLPKDLCVALSQDVNGSFFSTHSLEKSSSNEIKNWRSVFSRKFVKATQYFSCQWCDCTSTRDHISNTVCQPCEIKRPRLPFSVGSPSAFTRTVEPFISYILHFKRIRE